MKETDILQLVRLRASELGAVLWRNNVGKLRDEDGRWVRFGLCVGSCDLIGHLRGRFLAIEVKRPGKMPEPEQEAFINHINKSGGIAAVVTHPDQLENILK